MDPTVVAAIITGAYGVAIAIIGCFTAREHRAREESERAASEREEQARERDERIMGLLYANSEANRVTLRYLHGEKLNGDVDRALKRLDGELDKYSELRDHITARL